MHNLHYSVTVNNAVEHKTLLGAFVVGVPGEPFSITLGNRSPNRVLFRLFVDGRNVADPTKSVVDGPTDGFILRPYSDWEIKGWRRGADESAQFFFALPGDSYVEQVGGYADRGNISAEVFLERPVYRDRLANMVPGLRLPSIGAPQAAMSPETLCDVSGSLGAGYGRAQIDKVKYASFDAQTFSTASFHIKYGTEVDYAKIKSIDPYGAPPGWNGNKNYYERAE